MYLGERTVALVCGIVLGTAHLEERATKYVIKSGAPVRQRNGRWSRAATTPRQPSA
jgi:hypothetical protein